MPLNFERRVFQHLSEFDSTDRKTAEEFIRQYESLPVISKSFHLIFRTDKCARYFAAVNSYVNSDIQTQGARE